MRINIQAFGFPLTAMLLDHIERQLRFAATGTNGRIRKVVVRLGETNVSRGGGDKFCRMQVYLEQAAPVLIEDTGADLYAVINRVAERTGRNVASNVERRHGGVRYGRDLPAVVHPSDGEPQGFQLHGELFFSHCRHSP